eukprot:gene5779-7189_t
MEPTGSTLMSSTDSNISSLSSNSHNNNNNKINKNNPSSERLNNFMMDLQDEEDVISLEEDEDNSSNNSSSVSGTNSKITLKDMNSLRDKGWGSTMMMDKLPGLQKPKSVVDDKQSPWFEERQVIATLYRARVLLREMLFTQLNEERLRSGNLCVAEIQSLLNNQKEDVETDWIAEIQELKRNMVAEIRRNHLLERDVNKLDKRIALLIKHRSNIKEAFLQEQNKKPKKKKGDVTENVTLDQKQLESYQNLFYLLQTEPHYLAKLVTLIQADKMEDFLDTVILTLFGDAFSPREEFLILSLFRLAIGQEMSNIKSAGDLLSVDSVVPKMIITYTRRKQGHEFLKQIIAPILENYVVNSPDLNLELNAVQVYQNMISEQEIQTGAKSTLNRGLGEDQIVQLKEVQDILNPRVEKCIQICEKFFNGIIQSLNRLPYGIRWICKQIQQISQKNFNTSTPDEIAKVIGYFVYYRFINLAIVTPDAFEILEKELSITSRKNLVNIAKVLQNLFTLKTFQNQGSERWMQPLNSWILSKTEIVRQYFEDLVQVTDPSEYLRVDKYNELTLKLNPVVVISLGEISQTHKLLVTNLNALKLKEKEDPLELILKSLPAPLEINEENDREIQLTLTNRFKEHMEREISTSASLLAETKELVISVFRSIPIQEKKTDTKDDFVGIMKLASKYGVETNNNQLSANAEKILENMKKLEAEGTVQGGNQYEGFIRVIALEVINRQEIREHQRKERMRLTIALRDLRKHQSYLNEQIQHYTSYLKDVLLHYGPKDSKKKSKPIKMSYKDLSKKGIIVESDIPKLSHGTTSFYISSDTPGIFDIEAKIGVASVGTISLSLDDLLDKSSAGIPVLKLENIVLDDANLICKSVVDADAKVELSFRSGAVNQYQFNCNIVEPEKIALLFRQPILIQIDWNFEIGCRCFLEPHLDNNTYVKGISLSIPASPIGFTETYYDIQYCQMERILTTTPPQKGDLFEQIIILDGGPKYLSGSVYLFIGMGLFSVILSSIIIGILCHRWGELSNQQSISSIEMKSLHVDINYLSEQEKIQSYLKRIDSFFKK